MIMDRLDEFNDRLMRYTRYAAFLGFLLLWLIPLGYVFNYNADWVYGLLLVMLDTLTWVILYGVCLQRIAWLLGPVLLQRIGTKATATIENYRKDMVEIPPSDIAIPQYTLKLSYTAQSTRIQKKFQSRTSALESFQVGDAIQVVVWNRLPKCSVLAVDLDETNYGRQLIYSLIPLPVVTWFGFMLSFVWRPNIFETLYGWHSDDDMLAFKLLFISLFPACFGAWLYYCNYTDVVCVGNQEKDGCGPLALQDKESSCGSVPPGGEDAILLSQGDEVEIVLSPQI